MYDCHSCDYLDKSRVEDLKDGMNMRYGCNSKSDGFICGWIRPGNDNELKHMGCSDYKEKEQLQVSLF